MAAANQPDRGDDREAIDRAFADLVAGYHLTAERADPPAAPSPAAPAVSSAPEPEPARWADDHPLFRHDAPPPDPETRVEPEEVEERFVPPPPAPLPKPAWPVLLAWLGMGYAVLTVLAVVVGARLPGWAGWLAILGFVAGFGVLVARLPRQRPPDAGDGAVL
jgi:hypothetical protein